MTQQRKNILIEVAFITIMLLVVWLVGTADGMTEDYFNFYEYCEGVPWYCLLFDVENWCFENPIIVIDHGRWRTEGRDIPCFEVADVNDDGKTNMVDFGIYAKYYTQGMLYE